MSNRICIICGEAFTRTDAHVFPGKIHRLLCAECINVRGESALVARNRRAPWRDEVAVGPESIVFMPLPEPNE